MQVHDAFKDSFWEIEQNWETLSKLFDPTTIKGFLLPPYCFSNKWEFLHWKNFTFTWSTKWKIKLSTTHKGRPFYPALLWVLFSVVGFSSVIWIYSWYFTNTHIFSLPLVTNERRTHALRYTFWCSHHEYTNLEKTLNIFQIQSKYEEIQGHWNTQTWIQLALFALASIQ